MKICFMADGGSIHVIRWCEFFRDRGDEVSLITFRAVDIEGINVVNIGDAIAVDSSGGNFHYLKKITNIKKIIRQIKPDIVNAHYLTSYGLLGVLTKNTPLVVSTWGSDILVTPKKNFLYKKLTQYVLSKANLVTSDSKFMSDEIIRLGMLKDKVVTAPMGIDNSIFNLSNSHYDVNRRNILSLRTLCNNSNIEIIIEAFYKLISEKCYNDVNLIIANDGCDRAKLEELCSKFKIEDKVTFLGSVSRDKVVELLKENKIYISIPTSDSTSVTLLEAMACGVFPIVSNIPANKEWIINNYNGYIIEQINCNELYISMKNALSNKISINKVADVNYEIIKDRAIWEDNMNFIRDAYLKLLN